MKNLGEVAFVVQARLSSQRTPQKMIRPFAGTTLFDLVLDKLVEAKNVPNSNIFASVYEKELIDKALLKEVNVWERSYESAHNDNDLKVIFDWHNQLPAKYKYVIIVSGCNPLLKVETIDKFVEQFVIQEEENLFGVIEKKQYYWNKEGTLVTPWPEGQTLMNTKAVEPTYEAAHVLYASKLDLIDEYKFMGDFDKPGGIKLFPMEELEVFDIDYEWQFKVGETLYNTFRQ